MKDLQIKKLYYSISEVSKMVGLEQYVLRYWETEFEQLRPQKNRAGNRVYTERDIEVIKLIKKLTREERYTIPGARQVMSTMSFENGVPTFAALVGAPEEPPVERSSAPENGSAAGNEWTEDLRTIRASLVKLLHKLEAGVRG
jgi:DNA-binding transcriptional MerR regulator